MIWLPTIPTDPDKLWFTPVLIRKNTLSSMFNTMYSEAGIKGTKTNHSLRATGASELFQVGVPENVLKNGL